MRERLRSYPARGESRDPTPPALACPARPPPGAKVRARPRGRSPGPGRARWGRGPGRRPPRPPACIPRASGRGAALSSPRRARLCHGARLGTHWKPASRLPGRRKGWLVGRAGQSASVGQRAQPETQGPAKDPTCERTRAEQGKGGVPDNAGKGFCLWGQEQRSL